MADPQIKSPFPAGLPERFSEPTPIAPDEATWRRLTPAEKDAKILEIVDALPLTEVMSEGTPHSDAKMAVVDSLRRFYGHRRRGIFVAPELAVFYPGEHTFVPDVLVVRDVELKPRNAWVVLDEGRGPDFVLEIRNTGRRAKDHRRNVEWFARLGIREYFIYEVNRNELAGFVLETEAADRYTPIVPQGGRYRSFMLDLDLAVVDEKLRFYFSGAELPDAAAEVDFLTRMVEDRTNRLEAAERLAQAEAERARTEAERARTESDLAVAALRGAIVAVLAAQGRPLSADAAERLAAVTESGALSRLLTQVSAGGDLDA